MTRGSSGALTAALAAALRVGRQAVVAQRGTHGARRLALLQVIPHEVHRLPQDRHCRGSTLMTATSKLFVALSLCVACDPR